MSTLQSAVLDVNEIAQVSGGYYMDWDWCGTKVPGWPRPKSLGSLAVNTLDMVALNPQPLPPQGAGLGMTVSY